MESIFGRIRSGAGKAAFEADKLRRVNAIKGEIKALTEAITQTFYHVGQVAYELYRQNQVPQPALNEVCAQLADLQRQILEKEKAIEQIRQEEFVEPVSPTVGPLPAGSMQCPEGHGPLPQQARFCPVCGSPGVPVRPAAPAGRFCPNCGEGLSPGGRFCPSCGTNLPAAVPPSPPEPAPIEAPGAGTAAGPAADPAPVAESPDASESMVESTAESAQMPPEEVGEQGELPTAAEDLEEPSLPEEPEEVGESPNGGDEEEAMEEAGSQGPPSQRHCPDCGAKLIPEAQFCPDCGQPVA